MPFNHWALSWAAGELVEEVHRIRVLGEVHQPFESWSPAINFL